MTELLLILIILLAAACLGLLIYILSTLRRQEGQGAAIAELKRQTEGIRETSVSMRERQDVLISSIDASMARLEAQMGVNSMQNEQKLDNMRRTITDSLHQMSQSNTAQLEVIRKTVDEKLQDTLDKKLTQSFESVSQRLEQVYKGLGEMQTLAAGVGDLKKVLSNVKTRGTLGEIQLGAILEQILSPEQYAANVATRPGSQANVEFAVKLPGEGGEPVWLPIDSKFPLDAYESLLAAYEAGDAALVEEALKTLRQRVRAFAKDIRDKYIAPPNTTDFAIMFLPTEGLYAELVRAGMVEVLQREFKVNLAGPTTMGALLNSLQMGFRTLAIQKRSGEVWTVLGNVKSEFETFAQVLEQTKNRLNQANNELDKLVGVRTRQIQRALKDVEALPEAQVAFHLPEDSDV